MILAKLTVRGANQNLTFRAYLQFIGQVLRHRVRDAFGAPKRCFPDLRAADGAHGYGLLKFIVFANLTTLARHFVA
jgi:hypothetical protein